MRCLNEYIARLANTEDGCTGRFLEGRFKSQALLDEAAVLAWMAYVDLNPIRAGMAETPETSEYTSLFERIQNSDTGLHSSEEPNDTDMHRQPSHLLPFSGNEQPDAPDSALPFYFLDYLSLVDWTGRAVREDKRGAIPENLTPILLRLGVEPENWLDSVCQFESLYRRVMGPVRKLRELAEVTGIRWFHGISRCLQFYRPSPA